MKKKKKNNISHQFLTDDSRTDDHFSSTAFNCQRAGWRDDLLFIGIDIREWCHFISSDNHDVLNTGDFLSAR